MEHKRGDSFVLDAVLFEDDEVTPVDITGWTITSQLRKRKNRRENGDLVDNLTVTIVSAVNGQFQITNTTDPNTWPIFRCELDIQYKDLTDKVVSSDTIEVDVVKDITLEAV